VDTFRLAKKEFTMPRTHPPYPPEFRQQMVELVRAGRTPEELAREFEPSGQTIRNWVQQADRDDGRRQDGLTTAERQELARLRRENKQLRLEREILSHRPDGLREKPRPGSRGRPARCPTGLRVREDEPGQLSHHHHVPPAGRLPQRLLRLAPAAARAARPGRWQTDRAHTCTCRRCKCPHHP
jgi:transposase